MSACFVPTAPKAETVDDFWQMVWHENVSVIAALVLVVEGGKVSVPLISSTRKLPILFEVENHITTSRRRAFCDSS